MNENTKYKRTADYKIYQENRYNKPKECFKEIAKLIKLNSGENRNSDKKLIDIGCATGESLYYYRSINDKIQLHGVEYLQSLIDRSSEFLKPFDIIVQQGDANDLRNISDNSYDFVVTSGVTCIFDDFTPSFNEMIRIAKNGARCVNHLPLNEIDIDVIIGYRNPETGTLESGWNKFAVSSVSKYLENKNEVGHFEFKKFELPFDLPKREDDLLRVWTIKNQDGKRIFWNGLNTEISQYFVTFDIKK